MGSGNRKRQAVHGRGSIQGDLLDYAKAVARAVIDDMRETNQPIDDFGPYHDRIVAAAPRSVLGDKHERVGREDRLFCWGQLVQLCVEDISASESLALNQPSLAPDRPEIVDLVVGALPGVLGLRTRGDVDRQAALVDSATDVAFSVIDDMRATNHALTNPGGVAKYGSHFLRHSRIPREWFEPYAGRIRDAAPACVAGRQIDTGSDQQYQAWNALVERSVVAILAFDYSRTLKPAEPGQSAKLQAIRDEMALNETEISALACEVIDGADTPTLTGLSGL